MRAATKIEYLDDERDVGNGVLVTLFYGWSFEPAEHAGVRGFDTMKEAKTADVYPCKCAECERHLAEFARQEKDRKDYADWHLNG